MIEEYGADRALVASDEAPTGLHPTGFDHGELEALAARCEAATEPDRQLDCEVLAAIDWREPDWQRGERTVRSLVEKRGIAAFTKSATDGLSIWRHLPRPTSSLDDAMTLVPEGHLSPSDIVREALSALGRHFGLHMMHWPLATPYQEYLARFVSAAALRAIAAGARSAET